MTNFLKSENNLDKYLVRNKKELEKAVKANQKIIVAKGDLARQIQKAEKIKQVNPAGMAALGAACVATPVVIVFPVATVALAPLAALTGIQVVYLVAILTLGFVLITAICKGYTVEYSTKDGEFYAKMEANKS